MQIIHSQRKNILFAAMLVAITAFPIFAFAQGFSGLFKEILIIFEGVSIVLIGLAVLFFLVGILRFAFSESDTVRNQAKQHMLWGIVALAVMVFVWAFVAILNDTVLRGAQIGADSAQPEVDALVSIEDQKRGEGGVATAVNGIIGVVTATFPVIIGLGVLFFIWGVFQYIQPSNADKKGDAVGYIGWALLLLFIMLSVWGFVRLLGQSIGVSEQNTAAPAERPVTTDELIVGGN